MAILQFCCFQLNFVKKGAINNKNERIGETFNTSRNKVKKEKKKEKKIVQRGIKGNGKMKVSIIHRNLRFT